jgi:hypothetical protein
MNARLDRTPVSCFITASLLLSASMAFGQDAPATETPPVRPDAPVTGSEQAVAELPEAKEVLTQCIDAMGGIKVFEDMTSTMAKCTIANPQMGEAKLELYWMKPNKVFIKQSMTGMESTMGSDGVVAWMKTPLGPQILDAEAARELREEANMFRMVVHFRNDMKEAKTLERVQFAGSECFKLSLTDDRDEVAIAYFDVTDHLIKGVEQTEAGAPSATTYRFSEWKEDAGIKYFTRVEIEQMGQTLPLVFDEVKFNSVDEAIFVLPEEIQAMLKERDAPSSAPAVPPASAPASAPADPAK